MLSLRITLFLKTIILSKIKIRILVTVLTLANKISLNQSVSKCSSYKKTLAKFKYIK